MNRKTLYILVAVLVVVIVAAVAGVLLLNTQPVSVANATSLEFTVNVTTQGTTTTLAFYGKNIGTSNLTIRLDILGGASGNWSYILDTGQEEIPEQHQQRRMGISQFHSRLGLLGKQLDELGDKSKELEWRR